MIILIKNASVLFHNNPIIDEENCPSKLSEASSEEGAVKEKIKKKKFAEISNLS